MNKLTFLVVVAAATLLTGAAFAQITPSPVQRQLPVPAPHQLPPNVTPQRAAPSPAAPSCNHTDCDGDGHSYYADHGDDCDDNNAQRYPGNSEVADAGIDQDCNPRTFGVRDADHDGYIDQNVYNIDIVAGHEVRYGGDDCDDGQSQIHPNAQELPNHVDDNCDGIVDNLVGDWYTPAPRH
ncbi:MAG: putative metal-binding motif-containing protein [Proteobacteria bacterium]|nr:putative metal-binding motif-containing protein [Pseudomonadota bacterium]